MMGGGGLRWKRKDPAPTREGVSGDAEGGDGLVDGGGKLTLGVGVPRRVPRSGGLGGCVHGGVVYGVPTHVLVVGDGVRVDVSFDLAHVGNESAVRAVIEEALEAAVRRGAWAARARLA